MTERTSMPLSTKDAQAKITATRYIKFYEIHHFLQSIKKYLSQI